MTDQELEMVAAWLGENLPQGTPLTELFRRVQAIGFDLRQHDLPRLADECRIWAMLHIDQLDIATTEMLDAMVWLEHRRLSLAEAD